MNPLLQIELKSRIAHIKPGKWVSIGVLAYEHRYDLDWTRSVKRQGNKTLYG